MTPAGRVPRPRSLLGVLPALPARAAAVDSVRDQQLWVLGMMNVQAAWQVSEGSGVTVAVIDSGVNPDVSDLAGSVISRPDYTGVHTPPSNPNWGLHGTWMASMIAGHGTGGGATGSGPTGSSASRRRRRSSPSASSRTRKTPVTRHTTRSPSSRSRMSSPRGS